VKDWKKAVVSRQSTLRDTIEHIDAGAVQIALVVDERGRLLGTVTDGDVRRALLRGRPLESPVTESMNPSPQVVRAGQEREATLAMMRRRALHQLPVVDAAGVVVGLEVIDDLVAAPLHDNLVVLMAGGLGTRLRPLTDDCPKPMLKVGDRPILEHILEGFVAHGFRQYLFAVNYMGDMIEEHFGDGARWGAEIGYLRERQPLGTAGALALMEQRPSLPFVVMNGDILTKVDFTRLIDFHARSGCAATVCVRKYEFQIPYGVVAMDHERVSHIEEKPRQQSFVSAGIYVLDPAVLDLVKAGSYLDMPELIQHLIDGRRSVAAFPLREYWLDIGRLEDFERAEGDLKQNFR
jgi:dTDP-glucose pyrophosphorylase